MNKSEFVRQNINLSGEEIIRLGQVAGFDIAPHLVKNVRGLVRRQGNLLHLPPRQGGLPKGAPKHPKASREDELEGKLLAEFDAPFEVPATRPPKGAPKPLKRAPRKGHMSKSEFIRQNIALSTPEIIRLGKLAGFEVTAHLVQNVRALANAKTPAPPKTAAPSREPIQELLNEARKGASEDSLRDDRPLNNLALSITEQRILRMILFYGTARVQRVQNFILHKLAEGPANGG
jgi:hypothetical protein